MKLLQKTSRQYLVSTLVALLIALPVFYLVLKLIVQEDIDEDIRAARAQILPELREAIRQGKEHQFLFLDHDMEFSSGTKNIAFDSIYTIIIPDTATGENVPHRVLETNFEEAGRFHLLTLRTSLVDTEGIIEAVLIMEIALLVLLFSALQLVNRRLAGNIWQPFFQTVHNLAHYKVEEKAELILEASEIKEFRALNSALAQLAARSRNAFLSQREFTENASHEMQTPLAVSQSKLELLMQTQPLSEEQSALISSIAQAHQRLSRLTRSLLLLTKMENNQFFEKEYILLNTEIKEQLAIYEGPLDAKKLKVEVEEAEQVTVYCNRTLLEILVANLLSNAIRHNVPEGMVHVSLHPQYLEISNTGKAVAIDDSLMFQRFKKDSEDSASIGLGLEIVKKIVSTSGFSLKYHFSEGWHTFRINFSGELTNH